MKNFKEKIATKISSDTGAVNTVELIILIALAVFAALALFRFVLTPTQSSADKLGKGIESGIDSILGSDGKMGDVDFSKGGGGTSRDGDPSGD